MTPSDTAVIGLCSIGLCDRPAFRETWALDGPRRVCRAHQTRVERGDRGERLERPIRERASGKEMAGECAVPECGRGIRSRGECGYHYDRHLRDRSTWPPCRRCGKEVVGAYSRGRCHTCRGV